MAVPIDRGWAWMCVLGAAVCSFFVAGGIRSLGILLVEIVIRFQATTATASLLMALVSLGVALVAPLSTALGERWTYRTVIMTGGILCGLGTFLTAFANNTTYVIIIYGSLTGVGFGCIAGPMLVVVGLYFRRRRSLANGLSLAGGSVGQLLVPLLMRLLLDEFGFSGGLMLYSAISLHAVAAALLMRPLSFYLRSNKAIALKTMAETDQDPVETSSGGAYIRVETATSIEETLTTPDHNSNRYSNCGTLPPTSDSAASYSGLPPQEKTSLPEDSSVTHPHIHRYISSSSSTSDMEDPHTVGDNYLRLPNSTPRILHTSVQSLEVSLPQLPPTPEAGVEDGPPADTVRGLRCPHDLLSSCCCCLYGRILKKDEEDEDTALPPLIEWRLFRDPLFVLYVIAICIGNSGFVNAALFLPAHAQHVGLDARAAAIVLSVMGVADLVGRVGGGWFADLGYLSRARLMALSQGVCALALALLIPLAPSQGGLIGLSVTLGLFGGCRVSLQTVVLIDFLGLEKLSASCGLSIMCQGLVNIFVPSLLGLLRDSAGSYISSYMVCAAMLMVGAILLTLEPCVRARRR